LFVISDWMEYLAVSTSQLLLFAFFYSFFMSHPEFSLGSFLCTGLKSEALFVLTFTLFEKWKKEQFVVAFTNSKAKKLLLSLLNTLPYSIAIVNPWVFISFRCLLTASFCSLIRRLKPC